MDENDLLHAAEGIGGSEKITMGDILYSIDAEKFDQGNADAKVAKSKDGAGTVNTTKLRKQMKALKKEVEKAPALDKPVSGRKRKKQEQQANYDINKTKLGVYIPQVKRAREEVQSDFTTADKLLHGGKVSLNSLGQIAANIDNSAAAASGFTGQLEQKVLSELKR